MEKLYLLKNKIYFCVKERDLPIVIMLIFAAALLMAGLLLGFGQKINKTLMCFVFYAISFVYYKWKELDMLKFWKNGVIFQSDHSMSCVNRYRNMIRMHLYFLLFQIFFIFVDSDGRFINLWLLVYIFIIGYALMNYNFIIFFNQDGYFTGSYYIYYQSVASIVTIKEQVTQNGILYTCKLKKGRDIVGYDRFLAEEYFFLQKELQNKNEVADE